MSARSPGRRITVERELFGAEVLVVDADPNVHRGLEQILQPAGLPVTIATEPQKALELIAVKLFGVVVIDLDTPTPNAGIALVEQVRERSPTSLVFVLQARKSFDAAVAAFRAGAHDVILKAPDQVEYLRARLVDAAGDWVMRRGVAGVLNQTLAAFEDFVKRLMEAERRAAELEDRLSGRAARAPDQEDVRILFVDADDRLYRAMTRAGSGFHFAYAPTGGEALDRATKSSFHILLVGPSLPDLPSSMVLHALVEQAAEATIIAYEPGGRLDIIEGSHVIPIVDRFTAATQLAERLSELAAAHRAKLRERRYLQMFRERHYELLRRLAELRKKIERAVEEREERFSVDPRARR